ncbi:MAG: primosomal protein DnaI [Bacilli bacterium]|nr:primosomal protein DnaI [Bacilli bacterium]MBP3445604.1 primosomal protein DnaI [Bacilli bacterium]
MKTLNETLKIKNNNVDLMGSFNESLKDEKFQKLISKLNVSYEELAHYTTLLEDSSIEYDHCLNCKNILECKNKIKGYAYLPDVKEGKICFGYKMCKKLERINKENKYLENVFSYSIPKEIKQAKMKDIIVDDKNRFKVIKWLNNFIKTYEKKKNQKGLYLYGSFGSGKTYLISAMFNELAKQGVKSAIIFWPDYLVNLKGFFGTVEYQNKLNELKKVPLLLIDDIGAETTTAWSRDEVLCPIIQYRMQEELPTFFTSNLDINLLEQHLSISKNGIEEVKAKRIIERIKQLTEELDLVTKNYRN